MKVTKDNFFPLLMESLEGAVEITTLDRYLHFCLGYYRVQRDIESIDSEEEMDAYMIAMLSNEL